ncbi:hypothetical protein WMF38_16525 [Sorangium sp. So ce118]
MSELNGAVFDPVPSGLPRLVDTNTPHVSSTAPVLSLGTHGSFGGPVSGGPESGGPASGGPVSGDPASGGPPVASLQQR